MCELQWKPKGKGKSKVLEALDGEWVGKEDGQPRAAIADGVVYWWAYWQGDTSSASNELRVVKLEKSSVAASVEFNGKICIGRMRANGMELHWSDRDVWVRNVEAHAGEEDTDAADAESDADADADADDRSVNSIHQSEVEVEVEDEFEHGEEEAHAGVEEGSDCSIHQFIATKDDSEADAASMGAHCQRSAIEAREAPVDYEDEPSPDNFPQKGMKRAHKKMTTVKAEAASASITEGDAEGDDSEADAASMDAQRFANTHGGAPSRKRRLARRLALRVAAES